jgi:formate dehydrogenase beta subunit
LIFDDLRTIQEKFGYLPADQMEDLSVRTKIPVSHIHAVAAFFPLFHLTPPPKVRAKVCMDMACHLRGAENLQRELKVRFGGMDKNDVMIGEVSCLGQCDAAPAIQINDHSFRHVSIPQAEAFIFAGLAGSELPHLEPEPRIPNLKADPYIGAENYGAVRKLAETKDWMGVIAQLKASGLAGLGGAGFPTGMKWETVRNAPGTEKYVICNADESEPGTIKDRFILEHLPHLVAEGMIIAGMVTGAKRGIMYIRHEYMTQEHLFAEEIERAKQAGALGENIFGSGCTFELEIFVSPGGYIQGEETALIEAIEGKRGEPRNKPPFPVFEGLYHKPTALNNVETFANVPQILVKGLDWYKAQGVNGNSGLKFVGVSGDVNKPGVFMIPMGTPMRDVIYGNCEGMLGGAKLKAFAPSGPSSGYLPASLVDTRIDFKDMAAVGSMMGSGAIVVYGEGRCMVDQALNATKFFRNESCGKCVPCRVGSQKMVDLITGWTHGKGTPTDMDLIHDLMEAMKLGSICGLGQFVHGPIASVIQHFASDLESHIRGHVCPDRICPMRDPGN